MKKQSMIRFVLAGVVLTGLMIFSSTGWSDDTAQLKQQVQALQERVNQLESQLADKQQGEDPFAQMMQMRRQMEHNIRQAFADTGSFNPRMDMKQAKDEYIITMDIPGMDKDKINVEVKEGMLIISGERRSEIENNNSASKTL